MRLRSLLFTPGDRPERVAKAWQEGFADAVVADLEDGVAPENKAAARAAVADLLAQHAKAKGLRAVRINAWPSAAAEADLDAVLPHRPDLLVIPKAADPSAVRALDERITAAEGAAGDSEGTVRLLLILESAAAVLDARALAAASPRTVAVALGAEDLAVDAGMRRTPGNDEVATARGLVALAAAAAGVRAIDMITADYQDLPRVRREAGQARGMGYAGKMCIHPAQVPVVHEAFAATKEEKAWARRVVGAVEAAGVEAGGVVVVEGKMVDRPLVAQARRILRDHG